MSEKLTVENILPMSNVGGEKSRGQPDVLLNLDSFSTSVEKRQGRTLLVSLTNSHSLQEVDEYFLVGAEGVMFGRALWLIDLEGNKTELAELPDFNRLYYVPIGDKVYISSRTKSFIFNKLTQQVEDWGIAIPEVGPDITIIGGGLPPGKYSLTFTRSNTLGELSGSGPVAEIDLSITGGISISNVASDFLVWITESNGTKFLLAGSFSKIQKPVGVEILQTLDVAPPDGLEHLIFFRGRIWGSKDGKILYSDSYAFNWFRPYNSFTFKDSILMLAHDPIGVYVGTEVETWFQSGDNIRQMSLKKIGEGVIKGALVYAPIGDDDLRVPVWASSDAIFAGINGVAVSLTDEKVDIKLGNEGAAFFRKVKGKLQLGVNAPSSGAGISDKVTVNVFREGRLINATYHESVRDHISMADVLIRIHSETVLESLSFSETLTENIT